MKLIHIILAVHLMGCGSAAIVGSDTSTSLGYSHSADDEVYARLHEACEHLPAHKTTSQMGNRPIVIDGVTFYCF